MIILANTYIFSRMNVSVSVHVNIYREKSGKCSS